MSRPLSSPTLNLIAENLWEYEIELVFSNMPVGHRMTVARLRDGSLWVHSPAAHTPELAAALAVFGSVGHVVAPNCNHDTFLEGWFAAYPQAKFYGAPGLAALRPELKFTDVLETSVPADWAGTIDLLPVRGMPELNEIVFLHRASRTLIVADLAFNLGSGTSMINTALMKYNGCHACFSVPRFVRATFKDPGAVRNSLYRILAWDFDRIILSHGEDIRTGGKEALRALYAFL